MTIKQIAKHFSIGNFEVIYDFIDDNAEWLIVGESNFIGKKAIIKNCLSTEKYFQSVTTNFETQDILSCKKKIIITGTAEFLKGQSRVAFIHACDIYEFNEHNKIKKITSYCINQIQH